MKATHILMGLAMAALPPFALCAQTFSRGEPVPAALPLGNKPGNPIQDMPPGQRLSPLWHTT
jgi:hypothetical protein